MTPGVAVAVMVFLGLNFLVLLVACSYRWWRTGTTDGLGVAGLLYSAVGMWIWAQVLVRLR